MGESYRVPSSVRPMPQDIAASLVYVFRQLDPVAYAVECAEAERRGLGGIADEPKKQ